MMRLQLQDGLYNAPSLWLSSYTSANGSMTLQGYKKNGSPRRTYVLTSLLMEEIRASGIITYAKASGREGTEDS